MKSLKRMFVIFIVAIIPLFIGKGLMWVDKLSFFDNVPGENGDWLNFWASYLGTVIAILIAIWVAKYESESNKKEIEESKQIQKDTVDTLNEINKSQVLVVKELDKLTKSREEISSNELTMQKEFILKKLKIEFFQKYYSCVDDFVNRTVQYNGTTRNFKFKITNNPIEQIKTGNLRTVYKRHLEMYNAELELNRSSRMVEDLYFDDLSLSLRILIKDALANNEVVRKEFYGIAGPFIRADTSDLNDDDAFPKDDVLTLKKSINTINPEKIGLSIEYWEKIEYELGNIIKQELI